MKCDDTRMQSISTVKASANNLSTLFVLRALQAFSIFFHRCVAAQRLIVNLTVVGLISAQEDEFTLVLIVKNTRRWVPPLDSTRLDNVSQTWRKIDNGAFQH